MNNIHHTHVLLSVRLRRVKGTVLMSNSNIEKAGKLAKTSGKPCAITEDGRDFYTFTVTNTGGIVGKNDVMSIVELREVK